MYGYAILKHAIRQVFGNLWGALQVSLVPFIIQTLALYYTFGGPALYVAIDGDPEMNWDPAMMDGALLDAIPYHLIAAVLVAYLSVLWMTVAWHRYVLLDEQPVGILPRLNLGRVLSYLVMSFAYGVVLTIIGVVMFLGIGLFMSIFTFASHVGDGGLKPIQIAIYTFLTAVFIYIPLSVIGFRMTATLPGTAVGAPVGFLEGWTATRHNGGSIIVLSVLLVLLYGANMGITAYIAIEVPAVAIVWEALSRWLTTMVSVSVLTTLYGHYVEGRPLVV